jgi:hypothetical protein
MRDVNRGGSYLAVHIRRGDYVRVKTADLVVPLKTISSQIKQVLSRLNLNVIFIATDATQKGLIFNFASSFII